MKKSIDITPNLETLFGTRDENLRVLEDGLGVTIDLKSDRVDIEGEAPDVARAEQVFVDYDHLQRSGHVFTNGDLGSIILFGAFLRTPGQSGVQISQPANEPVPTREVP